MRYHIIDNRDRSTVHTSDSLDTLRVLYTLLDNPRLSDGLPTFGIYETTGPAGAQLQELLVAPHIDEAQMLSLLADESIARVAADLGGASRDAICRAMKLMAEELERRDRWEPDYGKQLSRDETVEHLREIFEWAKAEPNGSVCGTPEVLGVWQICT